VTQKEELMLKVIVHAFWCNNKHCHPSTDIHPFDWDLCDEGQGLLQQIRFCEIEERNNG
jgi:hypothetical protein